MRRSTASGDAGLVLATAAPGRLAGTGGDWCGNRVAAGCLASSHSKPAGRDARAPHPPSAPVHLRRSAGGQVLEQLDKSAHGRSGAALGGVPVGVTEVERGTGDVDVCPRHAGRHELLEKQPGGEHPPVAVADLKNIGDRNGGMLTAGLFLKEFVPAGVPWAHIDIAGPAFNLGDAYGYTPKGGTGAAVRTLVQLLEDLAAG